MTIDELAKNIEVLKNRLSQIDQTFLQVDHIKVSPTTEQAIKESMTQFLVKNNGNFVSWRAFGIPYIVDPDMEVGWEAVKKE